MKIQWNGSGNLASKSYTCGYCNESLASAVGYFGQYQNDSNQNTGNIGYLYVCHFCGQPTFFDQNGNQKPGHKYGEDVKDINDPNVLSLYNEARSCFSVNAFTSVALCCRKLLMHIAVSKGAEENRSFIEYVEYLSTKNYIPPDAKDWVDHIRSKGNEANHEIVIINKEDAIDLLDFSQMLLRLVYEFPANAKRKAVKTT